MVDVWDSLYVAQDTMHLFAKVAGLAGCLIVLVSLTRGTCAGLPTTCALISGTVSRLANNSVASARIAKDSPLANVQS